MLISCGNKNEEAKTSEIKKSKQSFLTYREVSKKLVDIDIDTISNFKKLQNISEKINCGGEIAVIKIETKNTTYRIQPLMFCTDIFDYKLREIIYINPDSIIVNYKLSYPITDLKMILKKHLSNSENDENYPKQNEQRLISINVDSKKPIEVTKNLLLEVISNVNELNYKNNFSFMFEDKGIVRVINE